MSITRAMTALLVGAFAVVPLLVSSPAQAKSYSVSVSLSKTSVTGGSGLVISGKLSPASAGKTVHIQKYKGGTWVDLTTTKTKSSGRYARSLNPTAPGKVSYRVRTSGKGSYSSGTSKVVSVNVYVWLELAELVTTSNVSDLYIDGGNGNRFTLEQDGVTAGDDAWVNDDVFGGFGAGKTVWNLREKCIKVRGRAGIDDTSGTGAVGHLRISFDGSGDYSREFTGGDSEQITIGINKTRTLTIQSDRHNVDESTVVGLGEPEVLCRAYLPVAD